MVLQGSLPVYTWHFQATRACPVAPWSIRSVCAPFGELHARPLRGSPVRPYQQGSLVQPLVQCSVSTARAKVVSWPHWDVDGLSQKAREVPQNSRHEGSGRWVQREETRCLLGTEALTYVGQGEADTSYITEQPSLNPSGPPHSSGEVHLKDEP
jgi:hypothetical protein